MVDFLQYGFMQRALIAGIVIAVIAPLIGVFLVTRRYALIADTLSHVALAGVALGVLTRTSPVMTALIVTTVGSIGIETLRRRRRLGGESILSLFLSGGLALAIILLGLSRAQSVNVESYLFGSITTVSAGDTWTIVGLGIVVCACIFLLYRSLFLLSLDTELAEASGIPAPRHDYILVVLTAVTVTLSMRIVGILLVGALMVIPVLSAMQIARSFRATATLATLFSLASMLIGLTTSYYANVATGGTIVMTALGIFLLCMLIGRK